MSATTPKLEAPYGTHILRHLLVKPQVDHDARGKRRARALVHLQSLPLALLVLRVELARGALLCEGTLFLLAPLLLDRAPFFLALC